MLKQGVAFLKYDQINHQNKKDFTQQLDLLCCLLTSVFCLQGIFFFFLHFLLTTHTQYESHIDINDFITHHSQPHLPLTHYCFCLGVMWSGAQKLPGVFLVFSPAQDLLWCCDLGCHTDDYLLHRDALPSAGRRAHHAVLQVQAQLCDLCSHTFGIKSGPCCSLFWSRTDHEEGKVLSSQHIQLFFVFMQVLGLGKSKNCTTIRLWHTIYLKNYTIVPINDSTDDTRKCLYTLCSAFPSVGIVFKINKWMLCL